MDDERRNRHILSREEIEQMEKATEEERQKRLAPYKALRRKMDAGLSTRHLSFSIQHSAFSIVTRAERCASPCGRRPRGRRRRACRGRRAGRRRSRCRDRASEASARRSCAARSPRSGTPPRSGRRNGFRPTVAIPLNTTATSPTRHL